MGYDNVNRLIRGKVSPANNSYQAYCWSYDSFGNRTNQSASTLPFQTITGNPPCQPAAGAITSINNAVYSAANQISSTNASGVSIAPAYDLSGNITNDGVNSYLYDADGRVCAVGNTNAVTDSTTMTQYLYDASGQRVAKGTISNWSCDISSNGFTLTSQYILGPSGEQMTELDGSGNPIHTNAYASGSLIATYDNQGQLHFQLADWLGTKRVQTDYSGTLEASWQTLPFGDGLIAGTSIGATEQLYTGKERDTESGLDYFGARHYSSAIGRFMSPDWSANPEPVPYANLQNPQSLNLYAYAANNPLSDYDLDGHCDTKTQDVWCMLKAAWNWLNSSSQKGQAGAAQASTNFVVHSTIVGLNSYNKADTFIQQHPIVARAANAAMVVGTDGMGELGVGVRALTAADLGVEGSLTSLNGTIGVQNGIATVRINYIAGEISNSFEVISSLMKVAESAGATELRIEGTLANERLANILSKRYGMTTSGATDVITIPLKK